MRLRKRIIFSAVAALVPLGLIAFGFEISLRLKQKSAKTTEARRKLDAELGWVPTPNLVRTGQSRDAIGRTTSYRMTQDPHGFRLWGDKATAKKRVLVLGDSYTQADDIDDTRAYWAELARRFPQAGFWAFGCSGYGTFQQAIVLEKHVAEIKPDLLILQMSSNDVINNQLELEDALPFLTTPGARPYLMDDGSVRHYFATTRRGLKAWSYAYASLADRLDNLFHKDQQWVPGQLRDFGTHRAPGNMDELIQKATGKTAELLRRIQRDLGPNASMIAFYDEDVPPLSDVLQQACAQAGVRLVNTIGPAMMREEGRRGHYVYRTRDLWHWNDDGHKLVADLLEGDVRAALNGNKPQRDTRSEDTKQLDPLPDTLARDRQKNGISAGLKK